ncbi:MAG TPA: hypothetical protein VFR31_05450, partial [Thermoanaerobaculia bacterium]|nr:hypothetical protein [Thermoanaerobaculia bacterium]
SYGKQAATVAEGDWTKRIRVYESYFGTVPEVLRSSVSELDGLRQLRNGVAHTVGRELDAYRSGLTVSPKALQSLSEERLKKWFGLVEAVALSVDEHLRDLHVGEYEAILYYHSWRLGYKGKLTPGWRQYKKAFGAFLQTPVGKEFCQGLVKHYDNS